jgi:hypothetical protein
VRHACEADGFPDVSADAPVDDSLSIDKAEVPSVGIFGLLAMIGVALISRREYA